MTTPGVEVLPMRDLPGGRLGWLGPPSVRYAPQRAWTAHPECSEARPRAAYALCDSPGRYAKVWDGDEEDGTLFHQELGVGAAFYGIAQHLRWPRGRRIAPKDVAP